MDYDAKIRLFLAELDGARQAVVAEGDDPMAWEIWCVRKHFPEPSATPPYHVPGPYEIAMTYGAALVSAGKYDGSNVGAAMHAAWAAVPEFYKARDFYLTQIVPVVFGGASPQEPQDERDAEAGG